MNSQFYKNKILLPAIAILIATFAITPAISQQGFAETGIRTDVSRVTDQKLAPASDFLPEISDVKPIDVLETEPEVKFRGGTHGWSLVGDIALVSEINIEGNATRGDDGIWQVDVVGKLKVEKRDVKLVLKGKANDGHLVLRGVGLLEGGQEFKIFLVGNYLPTLTEGEYALGFKGAYVQFSDNGFRIPMMQVGKVSVFPA
ncbi:MAG: hypothetical protein ACE5DL_05865 [Nitrosopumilaceae archaeon]